MDKNNQKIPLSFIDAALEGGDTGVQNILVMGDPKVGKTILSTPKKTFALDSLMAPHERENKTNKIKALTPLFSENKIEFTAPSSSYKIDRTLKEDLRERILKDIQEEYNQALKKEIISHAITPPDFEKFTSLLYGTKEKLEVVDCIFIKKEHLPMFLEHCTYKDKAPLIDNYAGSIMGIPLNIYKDKIEIARYITKFIQKKKSKLIDPDTVYLNLDVHSSLMPKLLVLE